MFIPASDRKNLFVTCLLTITRYTLRFSSVQFTGNRYSLHEHAIKIVQYLTTVWPQGELCIRYFVNQTSIAGSRDAIVKILLSDTLGLTDGMSNIESTFATSDSVMLPCVTLFFRSNTRTMCYSARQTRRNFRASGSGRCLRSAVDLSDVPHTCIDTL